MILRLFVSSLFSGIGTTDFHYMSVITLGVSVDILYMVYIYNLAAQLILPDRVELTTRIISILPAGARNKCTTAFTAKQIATAIFTFS
jgi:hypothetical protein